MHTCPDCGNHDMQAHGAGGATVWECGLCGARFGDREEVQRLTGENEAFARGVDPEVWPLAESLDLLPGLQLVGGHAGDAAENRMPTIELNVADALAVVSLENLAKSLRLCGGGLRGRWRLELRFEQTLQLVVTPDAAGLTVRDAHLDVGPLARAIARDMRLSWWRHANDDQNG
ncbi:MAG: hypothetical protein H6835_13790 [Planctomycetes bacterium]|nr:hypothetical protein [Planctomycetota bacterium]